MKSVAVMFHGAFLALTGIVGGSDSGVLIRFDRVFEWEIRFVGNTTALEAVDRQKLADWIAEIHRRDVCVRAVLVQGFASEGTKEERAILGRARAAYVARLIELAGRSATSVSLGENPHLLLDHDNRPDARATIGIGASNGSCSPTL
jgi:hypothetical protein